MQYQFFTIPAVADTLGDNAEEMNRFLRSHRILSVQRELVTQGNLHYWCCCVEYIDSQGEQKSGINRGGSREKVDYRNILDDAAFARFRRLRECRKTIAEEEAVPPFAVFLDEQLATMAKFPELTLQGLKSVNGVGEKKIEKYSKRFLELWESKKSEKSEELVLESC